MEPPGEAAGVDLGAHVGPRAQEHPQALRRRRVEEPLEVRRAREVVRARTEGLVEAPQRVDLDGVDPHGRQAAEAVSPVGWVGALVVVPGGFSGTGKEEGEGEDFLRARERRRCDKDGQTKKKKTKTSDGRRGKPFPPPVTHSPDRMRKGSPSSKSVSFAISKVWRSPPSADRRGRVKRPKATWAASLSASALSFAFLLLLEILFLASEPAKRDAATSANSATTAPRRIASDGSVGALLKPKERERNERELSNKEN